MSSKTCFPSSSLLSACIHVFNRFRQHSTEWYPTIIFCYVSEGTQCPSQTFVIGKICLVQEAFQAFSLRQFIGFYKIFEERGYFKH